MTIIGNMESSFINSSAIFYLHLSSLDISAQIQKFVLCMIYRKYRNFFVDPSRLRKRFLTPANHDILQTFRNVLFSDVFTGFCNALPYTLRRAFVYLKMTRMEIMTLVVTLGYGVPKNRKREFLRTLRNSYRLSKCSADISSIHTGLLLIFLTIRNKK